MTSRRGWAAVDRLLAVGRSLLVDRRGNIAMMSTAILSLGLVLAAFAVDEGALYLEKRRAQSMTDLAAIAAMTHPSGREDAARQFMLENGFQVASKDLQGEALAAWLHANRDGAVIEVVSGSYRPDPALGHAHRFQPGASPSNAVRVEMRKRGSLYFGERLIEKPLIRTQGVAYASAEAAFSVGSRLASLNGGLLNQLLGSLLGSEINLSVMDYEALLSARIDVLRFLSALAVDAELKAESYDEILEASMSVGRIAAVMASLLQPTDPRAASALTLISNAHPSRQADVELSSLIDLRPIGYLGPSTEGGGVELLVDALQMLTASAVLADGKNQVSLDLGLDVPGLAGVTATLAIGEPPKGGSWFAFGRGGETVRTAQTRLFIEAVVGGSGVLSGLGVRLPLYVELAYAEARLRDVSCATGRPEDARVHVEAKPGLAAMWIAEIDRSRLGDFTRNMATDKARIVTAPLINVTGRSHIAATNQQPGTLEFRHADIRGLKAKSVSTNNAIQTTVGSLVRNLDLDVSVGGLLNIGLPGTVRSAVAGTLESLAGPLDEAVMSLAGALGVRIGEADVWVHGVNCQRAVLVQ
ncbi:MAG: pilus assembly protein TadG-related protein [Rhizobiaceae bacterium]